MINIPEPVIQGCYGALGSFFVNGSTYLKSTSKEGFDPVKFLKSVLMGAGVGFAVGFTGLTADLIMGMPIYASIGIAIENLLKAIFRKDTKLKSVGRKKQAVAKK